MEDLKFAAYLGISLVPALVLHEYAHAFVAVRLGDPTPKRWGRFTLNPKPLIDPSYFKNPRRDQAYVVLAGLLANIALAMVGGLVIRAIGVTGELGTFAFAWLVVNAYMFGFQLMPIPGFDGAKLLAPFLPPRPREVFVNLEQYLVLFVLVIFFILAGPLLSIVNAFANVACNLAAGVDCFG